MVTLKMMTPTPWIKVYFGSTCYTFAVLSTLIHLFLSNSRLYTVIAFCC